MCGIWAPKEIPKTLKRARLLLKPNTVYSTAILKLQRGRAQHRFQVKVGYFVDHATHIASEGILIAEKRERVDRRCI